MTDKTHLDALLSEISGDLAKSLVEEFTRGARDPDVSTTNYPVRLRALMDEHLQATDDASG